MKYWLPLLLILFSTQNTFAQKKMQEPFEKEFRQADSLANESGLPQSAVTILQSIYKNAKSASLPVQMLKAQVYLMRAAIQYKEGADTANIHTAVQEAKSASFPYNAIWHSIAAQLYHNYYQQHQWQVLQRTAIHKEGKQSIETWDAPHFFRVITQHYDASLENEQGLKEIDLKGFTPLLNGDGSTRYLRPALFDLLAFRAVEYYSNDEQGITRPAYQFTINNPEYLADAGDFSKLSITSKDTSSRHLRALQLYQEILSMHRNDAAPDALIDADLQRLKFVYDHATFQNKKALYSKALNKLANKYPDNATAAEARYRMLALKYEAPRHSRGAVPEKKETPRNLPALKAALEAVVKRFPKSEGGINAQRLINEIIRPDLTVQSEEAILPDEYSKVLVTYKNVPQVWGRVVKLGEEAYKKVTGNDQVAARKSLLSAKEVQAFSQTMPAADDYETHTTELPVAQLGKGIYALLVSGDASFAQDNNNLSYVLFQVSDLSFITRQNKASGYVLHRKTGKPITGAQLDFYGQEWKNNSYSWIKKASAKSAADGSFKVAANNLYANRTTIRLGDEVLYADAGIYQYENGEPEKSTTQTFFFTDRSIYRPGQTIYFKGITVRKETSAQKTGIVANAATRISFKDANGQELKMLSLTTNEFGSFTGTFIAPQTGITGEMSISNDYGNTTISVEEYKRPKFEVTFDTLKSSYALNERVTVTGAATAYAGNVIDGASVKYRVVRETRWPYPWLYSRMIMPSSASVEITNGTVSTDAAGKFSIPFIAQPDETVDTALQPIFNYTVYADVTDAAGETHAASETISAGYRSIQINASIPTKAAGKELEKLTVRITNLNGRPLAQQATISITPLHEPGQIFRSRLWPQPEIFVIDEATFRKKFPLDEYRNESDPKQWQPGAIIYQQGFKSNEAGTINLPAGTFKSGWYVITITAKDKSSGTFIEDKKYVEVMGNHPYSPLSIEPGQTTYQPGQTAKTTITSGFKEAYILQQQTMLHNQPVTKLLSYNGEPLTWSKALTEADRGGISLQWVMVKDNRVYTEAQTVNIPWSNKDLNIAWATHRDKLAPGAKETWTVAINGNKKEQAAAELLAGMYDASLDAFKPHGWSMDGLFPVISEYIFWNKEGGFGIASNQLIASPRMPEVPELSKEYEQLILQDYANAPGRMYKGNMMRDRSDTRNTMMWESAAVAAPMAAGKFASSVLKDSAKNAIQTVQTTSANIPLRKNLQETAFFFPQLKTDVNGNIRFSFTLPEALTEWKFMALAHTKDMAIGQLTGKVKTQKDLMVQPNLPRFFRQGDDMVITTKISNLSTAALNGTAMLEIVDARTLQLINMPFRVKDNSVSFAALKGQSTTASWSIHIPESRYEPVLIRITAQAGNFTDGEENMLPVLTNRTLVTETLPLWMNGNGSKTFTFDKLLHSDTSRTLAQHRLTVEYTANPAWYAVQALPYLMEYPYECAEQTFNRYYANALAAHILDKAPRVKEIFAQWKTTDTAALQSNLQKNEELKSALLEETPWVMEAKDEATQKHNIALLFDSYKLAASQDASLKKLEEMLLTEGAFPWFKGGSADRYITQYIATGIARLQHLGVSNQKATELQQRMQSYLDRQITADYDALIKAKAKMEEQQISYSQIQYLYLQSFSGNASSANKTAINYYKQQAAKYWPKFNPYLKSMIALSLNRMDDKATASNIIQSLRETAVHNEELGMYWKTMNAGYWWHEAPVEAQSLLVECFTEVAKDAATADELKRWLLKQKQTQNWQTTKATADACYALLLNGSQWLTSSPTVAIKLGEKSVKPSKSEAGTGYFKQSFAGSETTPQMGTINVTVSNTTQMNQPSYGAVYWQYFENLDKITTAATPLALRKQLFIERNSDRGPVLEEITDGNTLKVGDKVKVRIILQADRDMEYLHLKDMRAAAFEPVNVLSGYRWQGGLGYYESTRDASSNFFISYLPKGTYVFEYAVNVMAKGDFSNGISTIQCMYAPEFASHSEGLKVHVE